MRVSAEAGGREGISGERIEEGAEALWLWCTEKGELRAVFDGGKKETFLAKKS